MKKKLLEILDLLKKHQDKLIKLIDLLKNDPKKAIILVVTALAVVLAASFLI